jgi:hypothetical protein
MTPPAGREGNQARGLGSWEATMSRSARSWARPTLGALRNIAMAVFSTREPVAPKRGQFPDGHTMPGDDEGLTPVQSPHDLAAVIPDLKCS